MYKGVSKDTKYNKWIAQIAFQGNSIYLGRYKSEIEAAEAYNEAVYKYWNGNGYLNELNHERK